ncbi:hypothetical protein JCM10908_002066 [Rhodotorula pacifica]|uniref:uncharacterized protein n=1 Tax=Rhodotorula pacifica TaxID=1495444 RepID=UPI003175098E
MRQDSLRGILAIAALLVSVASAQPGRFPCGKASPNQQACDLLSHPTARRGVLVPLDSECVSAGASGFACGWTGARCTSDLQCDFGSCTGSAERPGVCVGGLGDPCEGPEGPDDSLCAGNLGCQVDDAVDGPPRCGGPSADCSFSGNYEASSRPNHQACMSNYCSPVTLSCGERPPETMARVPADQRFITAPNPAEATAHNSRRKSVPLPDGSACPVGFSACPVPRKNSPNDYLFACFDFLSSDTHCGGCHDIGAGLWQEQSVGVDCTALPGVAASSCVDGHCRIMSCSDGHEFDRGLGICVPMRYW